MLFNFHSLRLVLPCLLLGIAACTASPSQTADRADTAIGNPAAESVDEALPLWTPVPRPIAYSGLPGWDTASLGPGLQALRRSCTAFAAAPQDQFLSPRAPWAGRYSDWQSACAALDLVADNASARAVLEALFVPVEISDPAAEPRFTGYFEPTIAVSATPTSVFSEPVPARPSDLVERNGKVYQRVRGGGLRAYPSRKDITRRGVQALAYAHPADVFFLQIQGSGRMIYPDGRVVRAAYAANNGRPFRSTANWLMRKGWISRGEADMTGIKAWMNRTSERQMRAAMNANPRFVFFNAEPVFDPNLGPKGSYGVPLTPLGSMAVDTRYHAAGTPMFLQTTAPGLGGIWTGLVVAQDTGGAIKGPIRGDVFFGTGPGAGKSAETLNTSGRLWLFLPRALAAQLPASTT